MLPTNICIIILIICFCIWYICYYKSPYESSEKFALVGSIFISFCLWLIFAKVKLINGSGETTADPKNVITPWDEKECDQVDIKIHDFLYVPSESSKISCKTIIPNVVNNITEYIENNRALHKNNINILSLSTGGGESEYLIVKELGKRGIKVNNLVVYDTIFKDMSPQRQQVMQFKNCVNQLHIASNINDLVNIFGDPNNPNFQISFVISVNFQMDSYGEIIPSVILKKNIFTFLSNEFLYRTIPIWYSLYDTGAECKYDIIQLQEWLSEKLRSLSNDINNINIILQRHNRNKVNFY